MHRGDSSGHGFLLAPPANLSFLIHIAPLLSLDAFDSLDALIPLDGKISSLHSQTAVRFYRRQANIDTADSISLLDLPTKKSHNQPITQIAPETQVLSHLSDLNPGICEVALKKRNVRRLSPTRFPSYGSDALVLRQTF